MQNLPLSNSTYSVFTQLLFGCFSPSVLCKPQRAVARWPEGGIVVSKCTNTMMDTSSAVPANHCCRFVYTGPKWLPEWPPLHIKQTNRQWGHAAGGHERNSPPAASRWSENSTLIILYVQMGIQRLIDSIWNRMMLVPIRSSFSQGTWKTVLNVQ